MPAKTTKSKTAKSKKPASKIKTPKNTVCLWYGLAHKKRALVQSQFIVASNVSGLM